MHSLEQKFIDNCLKALGLKFKEWQTKQNNLQACSYVESSTNGLIELIGKLGKYFEQNPEKLEANLRYAKSIFILDNIKSMLLKKALTEALQTYETEVTKEINRIQSAITHKPAQENYKEKQKKNVEKIWRLFGKQNPADHPKLSNQQLIDLILGVDLSPDNQNSAQEQQISSDEKTNTNSSKTLTPQ